MVCHPEPGSAVSYALQNAKSPFSRAGLECNHEKIAMDLHGRAGFSQSGFRLCQWLVVDHLASDGQCGGVVKDAD